jgi:hypothetical protein
VYTNHLRFLEAPCGPHSHTRGAFSCARATGPPTYPALLPSELRVSAVVAAKKDASLSRDV